MSKLVNEMATKLDHLSHQFQSSEQVNLEVARKSLITLK